jgi:hypothetical protein
MSPPSRRRYLRTLAAGLAVGLAGCSEAAESPAGTTTTPTGSGDDSPPSIDTLDETPATTATTTTTVFPGYETTDVTVETPDGTELGSVTTAIADTGALRVTGLSDTDSLPEDRGMLFVFDSVGDQTFVMREMDFGLDIVYADAEGVITRIHHAPEPGPGEDGEEQHYPGRGQYVLEVNYEWTTERGVEAGDVLDFELPDTVTPDG